MEANVWSLGEGVMDSSSISFGDLLVQENILVMFLFRFTGFRVSINVTSELGKAS